MSAVLTFHARHAWFNVKEQFTDLVGGVAGYLLFPFYIWVVSKIWLRFNSYQGYFGYGEVLLYVGVTESLFLTFLRSAYVGRASSDFSISLSRPRSWLAFSFSGLYGRTLGGRCVYLAIFLAMMPFLGASVGQTAQAAARFLLLAPLLSAIAALYSLLFASAQVLWEQTSYFTLTASKIFLTFGGVFGPLADFSEPWRSVLVRLPPSDIFFQPGYYCLRGEFYGISGGEWLARVLLQGFVLLLLNLWFFRAARHHHQSWGG